MGEEWSRSWAGLPQREKEAHKPPKPEQLLYVNLTAYSYMEISSGQRKGGVSLLKKKYICNAEHFEILVWVRMNRVWAGEIAVGMEMRGWTPAASETGKWQPCGW